MKDNKKWKGNTPQEKAVSIIKGFLHQVDSIHIEKAVEEMDDQELFTPPNEGGEEAKEAYDVIYDIILTLNPEIGSEAIAKTVFNGLKQQNLLAGRLERVDTMQEKLENILNEQIESYKEKQKELQQLIDKYSRIHKDAVQFLNEKYPNFGTDSIEIPISRVRELLAEFASSPSHTGKMRDVLKELHESVSFLMVNNALNEPDEDTPDLPEPISLPNSYKEVKTAKEFLELKQRQGKTHTLLDDDGEEHHCILFTDAIAFLTEFSKESHLRESVKEILQELVQVNRLPNGKRNHFSDSLTDAVELCNKFFAIQDKAEIALHSTEDGWIDVKNATNKQ